MSTHAARRRSRRPGRSRWLWRVLLGVGVLLVAVGAWSAWTALQVRSDLVDAAATAERLKGTISDADTARATAELRRLQHQLHDADDRTGGLPWRLVERLPVVGDDARAVTVVSSSLSDLVDDGLAPLAAAASDLDPASLTPEDGRVPLARVEGLQEPVAQALDAFSAARLRLDAVDTTGLLAPVAGEYDALTGQVDRAAALLASVDRAVRLVPPMLGADGPRRYLLVFQNNAELRATGGLPGALGLIEARDGRVTLGRQLTLLDFPVAPRPVMVLPRPARTAFGPELATNLAYANSTPDLTLTADLIRAHWRRLMPGDVDGVVAVDPVAMSYLLPTTGGLTVDGVRLDAGNLADELLHRTYLRLRDPEAADEFFRGVARAAFAQFTHGANDTRHVLDALARAADEHRLLIHAFDPAEQAELAATAVGDSLAPGSPAAPLAAVMLNDATGAKISYYLRYDVTVRAAGCRDGVRQLDGTLRLRSLAPPDAGDLPWYVTGGGRGGVRPGDQVVLVDLYGPRQGALTDLRLSDEPPRTTTTSWGDRPLTRVRVRVPRGGSVDLTWAMATGPASAHDRSVLVTPGLLPKDYSSTVVSACEAPPA